MWKCPKCQTANEGNRCEICGEVNPYYPAVVLESGAEKRQDMGADNGFIRQGERKNRDPFSIASVYNNMSRKNENDVADDISQVYTLSSSYEENKSSGDYFNECAMFRKEEHKSDAGKPSKKGKYIIALLIFIIVCFGASLGFMEIQMMRAEDALNEGAYDKAKAIFESVSFYGDAKVMITECDYRKAVKFLDDGRVDEAEKLFEILGNYKDSESRIVGCSYVRAVGYIADENWIEAYDALREPVNADYEDSIIIMKELLNELFGRGVEKYAYEEYEEARVYLEKYEEGCKLTGTSVEREYADYLLLIEAHLFELDDVTELYELLDFEDTKEILLSDRYVIDFLMGVWMDSSENRIEFTENDDGTMKTVCSLPFEAGSRYKFSDGVQFYGSDDEGWTKGFKYEIIHKNKISVYCYKDGNVYTLFRQ